MVLENSVKPELLEIFQEIGTNHANVLVYIQKD